MNIKNKFWFRLALLPFAFVLHACSTSSPSHYISPRVTGRVIDAKSGQPIENVDVRRTSNDERTQSLESPKGGEKIAKNSSVSTARDGSFVIASERDLAFFRAAGWYSITLSFEHPDYYKTIKSYIPKNSTNTASGEPWIQAGAISMDPLPKK